MNDENSRTGSQGKPGEGPVRDAGDYSLRLFDDFPNPIWRSGQDAKCNYFNREWLAFTGRTLEQELGFGWTEGVHPEDRDRCLKTLRDAFDRRAPFETEYRLRYHDGTYRWLLDCGKPYHNPDGTFAGYLGSCYDIHARREAEIALLESEKRYRDMFEINNAVMFIVDPESRQIVDANAAACRFYGYSRDEMQHLLITQINIQDPQKTTKDMGVAAASPGSVFQFRHKKKNGEIRDVEVFSGTVYFGGRKLLHSIIQDVTDRTRGEEALKESETQYRDLVENVSEVIVSLDHEGKFTYVSPVAQRLYGYAPQELIGKNFLQFVHPDDRDRVTDVFRKELSGIYLADEFRVLAQDHSIHWISVAPRPIERDGNVVGFNYVMTDFTGRKIAEEALRESEQKFREIFSNINDGVEIHELQSDGLPGKYVEANEVSCRMLGYTREELLKMGPFDVAIDYQTPPITEIARQFLTQGRSRFETGHRNRQGTVIPVEINAHVISLGGRKLVLSVVRDITARKKAEKEEQLTRERFETLVKIARIEDADEQEISEYILQAARHMTGSTLAFIGRMTPDESVMEIEFWSSSVMKECSVPSSFFHLPVQKAGLWADAVRTRQPKIVNDYAPSPGGKGLPSGHVNITRFLSLPILDNGKVVMVAAVANKPEPYDDADATRLALLMQGVWGHLQQRRADEALRESEEKFRLFFNNVNDAVYVHQIDPDGKPGRLVEVNDILCHNLGYTREELLSLSIPDILSEAGLRRIQETSGVIDHAGQAIFETEHRRKDGSIVPVEVSTHRFTQGKILLALANARDITERKKAEEALLASEQKFHDIFNNSTDAIHINEIGEDGLPGRFSDVNEVTCRMLGYTREEILALGPQDIATSYHDPPVEKILEDQRTKGAARFETEYRTRNGGIIPVEIITHRMILQGRQVMLEVVRDITERRQTQEALQTALEKYSSVFREAPDAIIISDLETGELIEINDATTRIFGYSLEEMIGNRALDLGLWSDPVQRDIFISRIREQGHVERFETRHRRKSKELFYALINAGMVTIGNRRCFVAIIRDITERRNAEEALKANQFLLEEALDQGMMAYWKLDIPAGIFTFNDRFYALYGTDATREGGYQMSAETYARKFVHPGDAASVGLELQKATAATDPQFFSEVEHRIIRGDGEERYILVRYRITKDAEGRTIKTHGVNQDITERKKAEELLYNFNQELEEQVKIQTEKINASLNEKVLLLREIHHRVKNNLQLIISLTNLQMRESSNPQLIQMMKETQNRVRAMSLVHERLYQSDDIARINLADYTRFLATQIFGFYGTSARQVKLTLDVDRIMLDINTAIPTGLILNELVSNALKHGFPDNLAGEVLITAREEGNAFVLQVRDTGIGMPVGFDWKESQTLGLRLVWILTEQLNGTAELLPAEKGTAFSLRLTKAKGTDSTGM